ncbi:MAG: nucleotide exchange factor GrpE [Thermoanaerobaculum sp.]
MNEHEEKGIQELQDQGETPSPGEESLPAEAPEVAGEGVDRALQEELARLQEELNRFRELYLRKLADFENFRKRKEKEVEDFRLAAHADLVRDVLPVLDNLERALAGPEGDGSGIRAGVELVLRQLKDVLSRYGLVELNPQAEAFDPRFHEAIARQEREDLQCDQVLEVLQKGYTLRGKLLRPALVVVGVPKRVVSSGGSEEPGSGETSGSRGDPWAR